MLKNKENKREISTFRPLCKDLFKYIQRKIIKKSALNLIIHF